MKKRINTTKIKNSFSYNLLNLYKNEKKMDKNVEVFIHFRSFCNDFLNFFYDLR